MKSFINSEVYHQSVPRDYDVYIKRQKFFVYFIVIFKPNLKKINTIKSGRSYIHPLYTYNIAPYTNTITVIYNKVSLADDHVSVVDPLSVRSKTHTLYTYMYNIWSIHSDNTVQCWSTR